MYFKQSLNSFKTLSPSDNLVSVLTNLLNEIVDYAGLFPPAALELEKVVENYERYRRGSANWMLARVIIPAKRLVEFEKIAKPFWSDSTWPVSALVPPWADDGQEFKSAMELISQFNQSQSGAVVDAIEFKCPSADQVAQVGAMISDNIRAFLEVPHADDPSEKIAAIAKCGKLFAKIRTGGMTQELIPPPEQVARFIMTCAQHDVGFKATAGLHHPIRNEYGLTYEDNCPRGIMHGFVNVFVASALAFDGCDQRTVQTVLESRTMDDFGFSESQINFKENTVSADTVKRLRSEKLISFGSCSFEEPVDDLRSLGFESEIQAAI